MKISFKISFYLITVIIFFSLIVKFFDYRHQIMVDLYFEDMLKQKSVLFKAVSEMNGLVAKKNVEDYTLWDDMVDFINKPDSVWAESNLTSMTGVFNLNFIKIYNPQRTLVFETFNQIRPFRHFLDSNQIAELFSRDSVIHFYQITDEGLLEVFGATVHHVNDIKRSSSPAGYYFAGVIWNETYKSKMETMLDGKITVLSAKDIYHQNKEGQRFINEIITDPSSNAKIAEIIVNFDIDTLVNLSLFSRTYLWVVIVFLTFFVLFTYLVFRRWILKPLELISEALTKQTPQILVSYESKKDEFGYIAKIVNNFFKQKKQLSDSEELFRKSFEDTPIGMALISLDGAIIKFNNAFCTMFGYHAEEVKVMTYHELVNHTELQHISDLIAKLREKNENSTVEEISFKHKNGEEVWGIVNVALIKNSDNEPLYYISQIQNISDRKLMEQNLEDIVLKRTRDLLQLNNDLKKTLDELYQSQEIIIKQEKLASLGTMLAGIAHEINNPAQAIKFSLDALDLNIKDIQRFLEEVMQINKLPEQEKIERVQLLDGVIDYLNLPVVLEELPAFIKLNKDSVSRIENIVMSTKRMAYQDSGFTTICINEVLHDSLVLIENQLKYSLLVEQELDERIPMIRGLSQELGQVFINILINARDAIVEKGLTKEEGLIRIKTFYDRDCGCSCILLEDNGCGIKKENLSKICDPFFTTKAPGKGTGLGMNIVHRIIKMHNGEFEIYSSVGKGTVMKISLPAVPFSE